MPPKPRQLSSLTSVRFFAAFWVVIYHQSHTGGLLAGALATSPGFVTNLAQTGYSAVGLFFVLSGFILAYTYPSDFKVRDFWSARVARIYPVYLLGLALVAPPILGKLALHLASPRELFSGLASFLLVQAWHPVAALTWNDPGWSLSAEAFFYLMFPLVLVPLRNLRKPGLIVGMGLAWCAILILPTACLVLNVHDFKGIPATGLPTGWWCNVLKFNPLIRFPEFVFGVMLGRMFIQQRSSIAETGQSGWKFYVPAMVAVLVIYGFLSPHLPYLFIHNNAFIICNALLLYGLARGGGFTDRWLSHPWLIRLGEASYAIYLLHAPIDDWMIRIDKKTLHLAHSQPMCLFLIYVGIVITISLGVYRWLEEPARGYLRARLGKPRIQGTLEEVAVLR
jgi:peptidoglycan/LPS O-acetylase OafA/YrhL